MDKKVTIIAQDKEQQRGRATLSGEFDDEADIRRRLAEQLGVNHSNIRFVLCDDGTILFSY